MFEVLSKSRFIDWFKQSDSYKDNFSYEGLSALYDYLEDYEESTGEKIEFDPIALACDYNEYESLKEFNESYSENYDCLEGLEDFTIVIRINDVYGKPTSRFIVQVF